MILPIVWPIACLIFISILISFWLLRPYSADWLRYLWWRIVVASVEAGHVQSGDAVIRYQLIGEGPPLVMLHGGLSSSLDWYAQLPTLSKQYQLVLIDSRGHGGSTFGTTPLSYQLIADDVQNVLEFLSVKMPDVMGWSDGGNVGLVLLRDHPNSIRRLVAISANAYPSGLTDETISFIEERDPERPSLFAALLYRFQSPEPKKLIEVSKSVLNMWRSYPTLSMKALQGFHTPILLLIGEKDGVSVQHARDMNAALPSSSLVIIKSVGHNVPQASSKTVTHLVLDFLQRPHPLE